MRRIALAAVALAALIAVAGCGGGGSASPTLKPYTPPENVMTKEAQGEQVVYGSTGATVWSVAAEEITLTNFFNSDAFGDLGGFKTAAKLAGSGKPLVGVIAATASALKSAAKQGECQSQDINWVDPVTGTHWTGTVEICPTSATLDVRADGPGGEVFTLYAHISGQLSPSGALQGSVSLRANGTLVDPVPVWDQETQRFTTEGGQWVFDDVRYTGSVSMELQSEAEGTWNERGTIQGQVQRDGDWVTVWELRENGNGNFTYDDEAGALTIQGSWTSQEAWLVGEGMFWVRTDVDLDIGYDLEDEEFTSLGLDVSSEASNDMRLTLTVDDNGDVNGQLTQDGEVVATIEGNVLDGTVQICWTDDGCQEFDFLHWLATR